MLLGVYNCQHFTYFYFSISIILDQNETLLRPRKNNELFTPGIDLCTGNGDDGDLNNSEAPQESEVPTVTEDTPPQDAFQAGKEAAERERLRAIEQIKEAKEGAGCGGGGVPTF